MTRKSKRKTMRGTVASEDKVHPEPATQSNRGWWRGVLLPSLASALGLWAASPPLALGLLAWLAPLGWLWICAQEQPVGRRGYWALWLSGCAFWLLVLHGIRLAYWPLVFGWLSLSMYLAVYIPAFVSATRVMVWRWNCPLVMAAPVSWLGLELIRSYLLTGYAANSLAHTQVRFPMVIQLADQLGSGGISFVMMTVSSALFTLLLWFIPKVKEASEVARVATLAGSSNGVALATAAWGIALLAMTLGYGGWRLQQAERMQADKFPLLRALLLQENTPSIFDDYSPQRNQQSWDAYLTLTRLSAAEHSPRGTIDLVVWPESTFTANEPWVEANVSDGLPPELVREDVDVEDLLAHRDKMQKVVPFKAKLVLNAIRQPFLNQNAADTAAVDAVDTRANPTWPFLLVGNDVWVYSSEQVERFNSALWISPDAQLIDHYSKMHLVMFGEYIPLGPLLSWLSDWFGLAGANAGREVKSFSVGEVRVAPSICFESMMPRVIAAQVRSLVAKGESPDVLINITNDSWFRGSTMLDHHLACSQLCAVENRRPLLVAANTGLSASIDSSGRVLQVSQRLRAEAILAEPKADARWGLVQTAGYPLAWLCAAMTVAAMLSRLRKPQNS